MFLLRHAQQISAAVTAADVVAVSGGDPFHSPFTPPPGLDLTGLGLVDVRVLPHDDRPGRHDRHLAAQAAFGQHVRLIALRDGDVFLHEDGQETLLL